MPKRNPQGAMIEVPSALAKAVARVVIDKERVVVTRGGRPVAALVPFDDVAALEGLEDRLDGEEAMKRLQEWEAEGRPILTLDKVLAEYGLSRADLEE